MVFSLWVFLTFLIFYQYLGFPLLLWLFARMLGKAHSIDEDYEPTVTLIISAYNEEAVIRGKIENSLALDYPPDKLHIMVVSDCSTDRTDKIVQEFSAASVQLLRMPERTGKTAGLNLAVEQAQADMVIFSDANALYDAQAVRKLVRHFKDPTIGFAVGYARYMESTNSAGESEGFYWNFEVQLKKWESRFCSVVGGDGALYMIRRTLYQPLEKTDINDFVNALQIVAAGYRGIFDCEACCTEHSAGDFEKEFGRKTRIVNRSFNGLLRVRELLNPFRFTRFSWLLFSHKFLRWFSPFVLFAHFIVTLTLPLSGHLSTLAFTCLSAYFIFGLLAFVGCLVSQRVEKASIIFYLPYYFMLMNVACAYGIISRLRGDQIVTWSTVRSDVSDHGSGTSAVLVYLLLANSVVLIRLFWADLNFVLFLELAILTLSALLLYVYIGYPVFLSGLRSFFKQTHDIDEDFEPSVTLLIAAYNEGSVLSEKLQNSLDLEYPRDKLKIVVASDGSTDQTNQIATGFSEQGVHLLALTPNRGKVTALNEAFKAIDTDIVVLSDANVMYQPSAIRKLVRHFIDPEIGAVSGKVVLINDSLSYSAAENRYYSLEHYIQKVEGETGSMIGSDGAMYALRTEHYPYPPADTILDDFVISMSVVRQGLRLIHDSEAFGFETNISEIPQEYRRKVRIVAGGIQSLLRGQIYPPKQQRMTWFKLISHKFLRWFSGPALALLVLLLCVYFSLSASFSLPLIIIGGGVLAIFALEISGHLFPGLRSIKVFSLSHYLVVMHAASLVGCWLGLTGRQSVTWKQGLD